MIPLSVSCGLLDIGLLIITSSISGSCECLETLLIRLCVDGGFGLSVYISPEMTSVPFQGSKDQMVTVSLPSLYRVSKKIDIVSDPSA